MTELTQNIISEFKFLRLSVPLFLAGEEAKEAIAAGDDAKISAVHFISFHF